MKVPEELRALVEAQLGHVHRVDVAAVDRELAMLGVDAASEFAAFFQSYVVTAYASCRSYEQLCDLIEPTAQIRAGTNFVREVWGLPDRFICLTTAEGEGAYLFDRERGSVWDFELGRRDAFLSPAQQPQWPGFFAFLTWYLAAPPLRSG